MEKTCRTCDYWLVTGSGEYGRAEFPGSWGTERRDKENRRCRCVSCYGMDNFKTAKDSCSMWHQVSDIIDECEHCGALLFEYDRPATPAIPFYTLTLKEYEENGTVRFWHGGDLTCEHCGIHYHGQDPFTCGVCQGTGREIGGHCCDACHGSGKRS